MLIEVPDSMVNEINQQITVKNRNQIVIDDLNNNGIDALNRFKTGSGVPIVRESVYGNKEFWPCYYFNGFERHNGVIDPPMQMRGSRDMIRMRCTTKWGFQRAVVYRWLRMIKLTNIGHSPLWKSLARKVNAKYPARWVGMPFCNRLTVFIEGKEHFISYKELPAIKSLLKQLHKLNHIDRAIAQIKGET